MKGISKKFPCNICGTFENVRGSGGSSGRYYCTDCRKKTGRQDLNSPQYLALSAVAKARRKGELQDPKTLQCVDCQRPAVVYEHRDYNKPLDVQPVCISCNFKRGPAIGHVTKTSEVKNAAAS